MEENIKFIGVETDEIELSGSLIDQKRQYVIVSFQKGEEVIQRALNSEDLLRAMEEYAQNHFRFPKEEVHSIH